MSSAPNEGQGREKKYKIRHKKFWVSGSVLSCPVRCTDQDIFIFRHCQISIQDTNKTGSNIWSGNMDDDEEGSTNSAYF